MKPKQTIPLILLAFIWGGYYVASQQSLARMSSFPVGIVIRFITMILLFVIMARRRELRGLVQTKGILGRLLLIGCLGFALDITAFIGLSLSPAGSGTALLKTDIIFVNLISVFIYRRRLTWREWVYTLIMLGGVLMVMGIDWGGLKFGGRGDIFFVLSALFVSINAFVIKSVQLDKKNPASDNVIAFYNNFVTMVLFTISALVTGTFGELGGIAENRGLALALLVAGIGQTGVYIVYYHDLRRYPVWIVKVFLLLMPIVSGLLAFVLFEQTMSTNQYVGMAVVLLGALGVLLEQRKKSAKGENALAGI